MSGGVPADGVEGDMNRKWKRSLVVVFGIMFSLLSGHWASAQDETSSIQAAVEWLASDELEGRLTGSDGIRSAAEYIVRELDAIGATPLPGRMTIGWPSNTPGSRLMVVRVYVWLETVLRNGVTRTRYARFPSLNLAW